MPKKAAATNTPRIPRSSRSSRPSRRTRAAADNSPIKSPVKSSRPSIPKNQRNTKEVPPVEEPAKAKAIKETSVQKTKRKTKKEAADPMLVALGKQPPTYSVIPQARGPRAGAQALRRQVASIVEEVKQGVSKEIAASMVGIHASTWKIWRSQAQAGIQPYADFMDEILRAEAYFLAQVQKRMWTEGALLPEAWILERHRPDLFSLSQHFRKPQIEVEDEQSDEDIVTDLITRTQSSGLEADDSNEDDDAAEVEFPIDDNEPAILDMELEE